MFRSTEPKNEYGERPFVLRPALRQAAPMRSALAVCILLSLSLKPVYGTQVPPMSLQETIHDAGAIFVGSVTDARSHWTDASHRWMVTDCTFVVQDVVLAKDGVQKGRRVTFSYWGGRIGDEIQQIAEVAPPAKGERYVMMLRPNWQVMEVTPAVGITHGAFRVVREQGSLRAQDDEGKPLFLTSNGMVLRSADVGEGVRARSGVTLNAFVSWLKANVVRIQATPAKKTTPVNPNDPHLIKPFIPDMESTPGHPADSTPGLDAIEPRAPSTESDDALRIPPIHGLGPVVQPDYRIEPLPKRSQPGAASSSAFSWEFFTQGRAVLPIVVNAFPASWRPWSPEDQYQMSKWNYYCNIFRVYATRYTPAWGNGRFDMVGWLNDQALRQAYGTGWGGAIAFTFMRMNATHTILEADIVFNPAYQYTLDNEWIYDGGAGNESVQPFDLICLHELGHMHGMLHQFNFLSVMNYAPLPFRAFCLPYCDDAEGARSNYPARTVARHDLGVYLYRSIGYQSWTDANYPLNVVRGGNLSTFNYHVENVGTAGIVNPTMEWYLTPIRNYSGNYYYLGRSIFNFTLPRYHYFLAGATNLPVPVNVPPGEYYLGAFIRNDGGAWNTTFPYLNNYAFSRLRIHVW